MYTNLKTLDEKDCFQDKNTFSLILHQILNTVQKEWDEYNAELEYKNVFLKAHQNHLALTLHEQNKLQYRQVEPPKKLRKPAQGTDLYSNAQTWTGIPRVI